MGTGSRRDGRCTGMPGHMNHRFRLRMNGKPISFGLTQDPPFTPEQLEHIRLTREALRGKRFVFPEIDDLVSNVCLRLSGRGAASGTEGTVPQASVGAQGIPLDVVAREYNSCGNCGAGMYRCRARMGFRCSNSKCLDISA